MQQDSQKCICQIIGKNSIFGWNDVVCKLRPTGRFVRSEERKQEILEKLECECGKEAGERIYSSDRLIGCWRLYEHIHKGKQIVAKGSAFDQEFGKMIIQGFSALKGAEVKIQEQFQREMAKISLLFRSPSGKK